jgi:signal transduction histidine kinase
MIIHDLNNPLGAISGNIEMILLDKQDLTQNQKWIEKSG